MSVKTFEAVDFKIPPEPGFGGGLVDPFVDQVAILQLSIKQLQILNKKFPFYSQYRAKWTHIDIFEVLISLAGNGLVLLIIQ